MAQGGAWGDGRSVGGWWAKWCSDAWVLNIAGQVHGRAPAVYGSVALSSYIYTNLQ